MLLFGSYDAILPTREWRSPGSADVVEKPKASAGPESAAGSLMWPSLIVVPDIGLQKTVELFLVQDEEMIQAFSPHASQEAFTNGICSWCSVRRSKHFDTTCCCHARKIRPEFAIIILNQIFWSVSIWSRLPQGYARPKHRSGLGSHSRG